MHSRNQTTVAWRHARPLLLLIPILFSGSAIACWQSPTTGPEEIKWDRRTCERCQMVISERRFATQLRETGSRRVQAFDDLGCALLWLDEQSIRRSREDVEVWVRSAAAGQWIDGHEARFEGNQHTPMQYGWAAGSAGGSSLQEVHEHIRETERSRRQGTQSGVGGIVGVEEGAR